MCWHCTVTNLVLSPCHRNNKRRWIGSIKRALRVPFCSWRPLQTTPINTSTTLFHDRIPYFLSKNMISNQHKLKFTEVHQRVCKSCYAGPRQGHAKELRNSTNKLNATMHAPFSSSIYIYSLNGVHVVERNFLLLFLNCSAWPCLDPA